MWKKKGILGDASIADSSVRYAHRWMRRSLSTQPRVITGKQEHYTAILDGQASLQVIYPRNLPASEMLLILIRNSLMPLPLKGNKIEMLRTNIHSHSFQFVQVGIKVFSAKFMIRTDNRPLKESPDVLNSVGMDITPHLFLGTVINLRLAYLSERGGLSPVILWVIIAVVNVGITVYLVKRRRVKNTND